MDNLLTGAGIFVTLGVILVIAVVLALVFFITARSWMKVARPDEALVISGRGKTAEGAQPPTTVIINGKALVNPVTQRYETISLRSRQVTLRVEAQSEDNVTLQVEAVAIVKIGSDPKLVRSAAERFASQDKAIEIFTTEQLEGALRGVIATLSVVSLMRERKKFSDQIAQDVSGELAEQGLILDSFQIKGITDNTGYIQSLGVPQIEEKRQAAELASADANRAINERSIAVAEANLIEETTYHTNKATSQSRIGTANAQAAQAEALAEAMAQQDVLKQRAENRSAELDADVKRVADADAYKSQKDADANAYRRTKEAEAAAGISKVEAEAAAFRVTAAAEAQAAVAQVEADAIRVRAQAEADAIKFTGEAKAAAIQAEAEALAENQNVILAQRALDILPAVMAEYSKGFSQIGEITIIGGGASASDTLSGESSAAMAGAFKSIEAATGLDIPSLIQGRTVGQAIGQAAQGHKTQELVSAE